MGVVDKFVKSQEYKAFEKVTHETQMKAKSASMVAGLAVAPLMFIMAFWFGFGLIQDMLLPYGQEYSYFTIGFWVAGGTGIALSVTSIYFAKDKVVGILNKETEELTKDVYIKGAKFTNSKGYNKTITEYMQKRSEFMGQREKEFFKIPTVELNTDDKRYEKEPEDFTIPRAAATTGIMILGLPGSGKSVLINHIVAQTRVNHHTKQIIIDVAGEFISKHYNPETDLILCPADIRTIRFRFSRLVETLTDAGAIAFNAIPDDPNVKDPHWINAARAVFEALLVYAAKKDFTNKEIFEYARDINKLNEIIQKDEDAKLIAGNFLSETDESKSIISSLTVKSKFLQYVAELDRFDDRVEINLENWVNDGKGGRLFMLASEKMMSVFSPIYGVVTSYIISVLLEADDDFNRDVYFILDELPRLGKALGDNLEKLLAVGRKKGGRVVMAAQSSAQLKAEYGEAKMDSIFDTTKSLISFQTKVGGDFQEKYFGKTTVLRNDESFSFGMEAMADRVQVARREVKEALIDASEFERLNEFEFYAKIAGCQDVLKAKLALVFYDTKHEKLQKVSMDKLSKKINPYIKTLQNAKINLSKFF